MDTKYCSGCGQHLELSPENFNKKRAKDSNEIRYQPWCRECNKASSKQYYAENTEHHKKVVRHRIDTLRKELQSRIIAYLQIHPCVDCGEPDIVLLDFDHRDPTEKVSCISRAMSSGWSWQRLLSEISKCDVRCTACHRKRTAKQFNSYKYCYMQTKRKEFQEKLLRKEQ